MYEFHGKNRFTAYDTQQYVSYEFMFKSVYIHSAVVFFFVSSAVQTAYLTWIDKIEESMTSQKT